MILVAARGHNQSSMALRTVPNIQHGSESHATEIPDRPLYDFGRSFAQFEYEETLGT